MLTTFCLRLACGMIASLLLISSKEVNRRFFRTHYLVALGLLALAAVATVTAGSQINRYWWCIVGITAVELCLGSVVWSIEGSSSGGITGIASTLGLVAA